MTPAKRAFLDMAVWSAICATAPLGLALAWSLLRPRLPAITGVGWLPAPIAALLLIGLLTAVPYGVARAAGARRDTALQIVALLWVLAAGVAAFVRS